MSVMPVMSRFETIDRLHEENPNTTIIVTSTSSLQVMESHEPGEQLPGCDGFVSKPVETQVLLETIEQCGIK